MIARGSRGFTIIELVSVIVVLSILGLFTFSFLDQAVKTYTIGTKQRMIYQEASYIMERLTREMRDMSNVATCGEVIFNNSFTFTKRHRTVEGVDNLAVTYRRDVATNIMYRDGSGGTSPIMGRNISVFRVIRGTSGSTPSVCNCPFSITLTLQSGDQSVTLDTTVTPRNSGTSSYSDRCFNGDYEDIIQ